MDPSCTLGFYCRDKADFEMFCAQVRFKFAVSLTKLFLLNILVESCMPYGNR